MTRHVAEACDAVYLPDQEEAKRWAIDQGVTDWKPFGGDTMRAMAYRREGQIFVIFRGTLGRRDILTDLHCIYWHAPARHNGFALAWGRLKKAVEEWVRSQPSGHPVIFAGHSLGGALAVLAANDLAALVPTPRVVTFGCPRVGSPEFAWAFEKKNIVVQRFVHGEDGITLVPPFGLYFPIGAPIDLCSITQAQPSLIPIYLRAPEPEKSSFRQIFNIVLQLIHPALGHAFATNETTRNLIDPSSTSLGRVALGSAGTGFKLLFWLLLVPSLVGFITILFHPVLTTAFFRESLGEHAWLRWLAVGALLLTTQQVTYALAWGCPTWLRMVVSLVAAVWLGTHLSFTATSTGLVFLVAILLLVAYRLLGGSTDHPMAFYVRLLEGKVVRT